MYFDRFDICSAYYLFFSNYHKGQWSDSYSRMSKMLKYYKPGWNFSERYLTDNGQEIYKQLLERNGIKE